VHDLDNIGDAEMVFMTVAFLWGVDGRVQFVRPAA
jgi:hypothetical protein